MAAASNMSVGSSVAVIATFTGSPDPRQRPFGPGQASLSGRLPTTAAGRASHPAVVSRCLSAVGLRFSGHPSPAGDICLPHGQPTGRDGPHRGCHVPHMQDATGLGALSTPGRRCSPAGSSSPGGACRFPAASPPRPATASHLRACVMTRQHRGFTCVHPPGLSLARGPRMERGPSGLNSGLRTPQSPAAHAGAGTGHRALA